MKIRTVVLVAAVLLLQYSCQKKEFIILPDHQEEMVVTQDGQRYPASSFEQGHVRLQLTDQMTDLAETDPEAFHDLLSAIGVKSVERTFPYAGKFEKRTRMAGLHRWYDVYFDEEVTLTKAGEELSLIENLGYVEYRPKTVRIESQNVGWRSNSPGLMTPDKPLSAKAKLDIFNDPMLSKQWHYYNDGSFLGTKAGCDINVLPVWKDITTGRPDVVVSVVDGGVDFRHEDLADNMWRDPDYPDSLVCGFNFVYRDRPVSGEDHGTHVAGTIAAVNNNGIGVAGVAGGNKAAGLPGVKVMSCQIFIADSDRVSGNGATAIKWGADHGAVISQNSWGYTGGTKKIPQSDKAAIDYFNQYAGIDEYGNQTGPMKGGVVFFSAGNSNWYYDGLSGYEGCVAVGAVDAKYHRAGYSNYGDWVDVAAPGGDSDYGPIILSTIRNNKYEYYEGTSMACPHVSGVAALVVSVLGGEGFTRDMLIDRIVNNTTDLSQYGTTDIAGLLNAYAAITSSSTVPPDSVAEVSMSVTSNKIHFKVRIPEDADDGTPYGIMAWFDNEEFYSRADIRCKAFEVNGLKAGDYLEGDIDDLEFEKRYYIGFDAYDLSGNHGAMSQLTAITTGPNTPPVIESDVPLKDVKVRYCDTKVFNISYGDPDGHDVTVSFEDNSGAATMSDKPEQNKSVIQIRGGAAQAGSYEFKFTVTDRYGASTSIVVPYVIMPNTPPAVVKEIGNLVMDLYKDKQVIEPSVYFYDDDGEKLSVKYTISDKSILAVTQSAMDALVLSPLSQGIAVITVTVTDGKGETASSSFKVLVRDTTVPFDIYPNPVTDGKLFIRCSDASVARVVVGGPSGAVVFNGDVSIDPFAPPAIDLSKCSSGVYSVKVSNSKETVSTTIVNIHNE